MCHRTKEGQIIETLPCPKPRSSGGDPRRSVGDVFEIEPGAKPWPMDPSKPFGVARVIRHAGDGSNDPENLDTAGRIRKQLVTDIRRQIAAGTYENDAKHEAALSGVVGFLNVGSPMCPDCQRPLSPAGSDLCCRECGAVFQKRAPHSEAA